jgi:integrase
VKLDGGSAEIRRAFLFACHTGLRVSDLETLTWNKIETNPMQVAKQQAKTKAPVYIPLSGTAIKLIDGGGEHSPSDRVFNLPVNKRRLSYNILKRWAKAAGLTKISGGIPPGAHSRRSRWKTGRTFIRSPNCWGTGP